ncbi:MAG: hypothetical protein V4857_11680 [Pseudomonadota bacterium]
MANYRLPGPLGVLHSAVMIDSGTIARSATPSPGILRRTSVKAVYKAASPIACAIAPSKYFSHPQAGDVLITYGKQAKRLNADAEHLLRSILASAGMTEGYVSSTLRTYGDQARINYEQNSADQILKWYGKDVSAVWHKYKAEKKTTADYAEYLAERDLKRGSPISNHIPGFALDVAPYDERFAMAAKKLVNEKGSGVRKILIEKGCTHTEFMFKVTS